MPKITTWGGATVPGSVHGGEILAVSAPAEPEHVEVPAAAAPVEPEAAPAPAEPAPKPKPAPSLSRTPDGI